MPFVLILALTVAPFSGWVRGFIINYYYPLRGEEGSKIVNCCRRDTY